VAALQTYTSELLEQLRNIQASQAQEAQERQLQAQAERRRHESQLEGLRQEHSAELGRLMNTMVEQVDNLHQEYARRIKELEAETLRLRQLNPSAQAAAATPATAT